MIYVQLVSTGTQSWGSPVDLVSALAVIGTLLKHAVQHPEGGSAVSVKKGTQVQV